MSTFFFQFLLKYIHLIPSYISNFFLRNNKYVKSNILFDTIEYQSEYKGDNLISFVLPLLMNISYISSDVKKIVGKNKVVSIISVLVFYEKDSDNTYIHSLSNSNKLYNLVNFDKWPESVLLNLIEKLELYNSFKKISFIVKIKIITSI
jgi:hypothetical protein